MITVIDYNAGNLTSVRLAFEALGEDAEITNDPRKVRAAARVVFPGVGAARAAMYSLRELGLDQAIAEVVRGGIPFLGICLGTQIIFERSAENEGVTGLGLLRGTVERFRPTSSLDKVPQMGWNSVEQVSRADPDETTHPLFNGIEDHSEFYFVHSYYPRAASRDDVLGVTTYAGTRFASVVGNANVLAVQFHPEKSGRVGLRMLRNFLNWDGGKADNAC